MMATLGARLVSVAAGRVEIAAPVTAAVSQQHGAGHAALAFALGDSAAGYSALTLLPADAEVMTAEIRIHLLRPARGVGLVARGAVLKPGRRLIVVTAEVFALDGTGAETQVALLTGTMVPVAPGA
ncbi:MAG: PaaI family thioesterase [Gemmobacter sp.]